MQLRACGGQGRAGDKCTTAPSPATCSQSGRINRPVPDRPLQMPTARPRELSKPVSIHQVSCPFLIFLVNHSGAFHKPGACVSSSASLLSQQSSSPPRLPALSTVCMDFKTSTLVDRVNTKWPGDESFRPPAHQPTSLMASVRLGGTQRLLKMSEAPGRLGRFSVRLRLRS